MFKVLIADKLSKEAEKIFNDNGLKVKTKTGLKEDELIQELNDCDALVVRSATKATKKVIEKSKKLKVIGRVINLENEKNNLLEIELFKNQKEVFIPFVKEIVPLVDIKNNFLIINPPNGLLEL